MFQEQREELAEVLVILNAVRAARTHPRPGVTASPVKSAAAGPVTVAAGATPLVETNASALTGAVCDDGCCDQEANGQSAQRLRQNQDK